MKFFLVLFLLGLFITPNYSKELIHYLGLAYEFKSSRLLYSDEYKEYIDDEGFLSAEVIYRDPSSNIIASKSISYKTNLRVPSFSFSNYMTNSEAEVSVSNNNIKVSYYSDLENILLKTKEFPLSDTTVVDAGIYYFVMDYWDSLIAGDVLFFNYISPSNMRSYKLRIRLKNIEVWKAIDSAIFVVELDNFFMRFFLDPILLRYDIINKQLLRYEGTSNIKFLFGDRKVFLDIDHL